MEREKKLYLKTFGCQMNEADSTKIKNIFSNMNVAVTSDPKDADIVILNTCSVRWKAEHKVYSELGRFKKIKDSNPHLIIGVGGCVAQQEGKEMFSQAPHLDLVFGTHNIHKLPEMISAAQKERHKVVETDFYENPKYFNLPAPEEGGVKAFVNIIRGCNNFCSYCIVPYVRGREVSRPSRDIIDEIRALADNGVKEITLLGQNVNSYGKTLAGDATFPELLRHVAKIDGIERIRFTSSHPKDLSDDLIDVFGGIDKICGHLHLAVQSGSDKILELMKRGYTTDSYIRKVEKLKCVRPDISLTTDLIVGFPGEDDSDFQKTLDLIALVRFDSSFSFKYSRRTGTEAANMEETVPEQVKSERLFILQNIQKEHSIYRNRLLEGRVEDVLVDSLNRKADGMVQGRISANKVVNFRGTDDLVSKIVKVKITKGSVNSLSGELVPFH